MANLHEILTDLVEYAQTHLDPSTSQIETAIRNAAEQINQQHRERVEKLANIVKEYRSTALELDATKLIPMLAEIDTRAKAALAELEATDEH